jgi:hypothetical protein
MGFQPSSGELRTESGFATWGGFQTFYTNGSERLRITSAGLVGIGTSSVSNKLVVNVGTEATDGIYLYGTGGSTPTIYFGHDGSHGTDATISSNPSTGHFQIVPRSGYDTVFPSGRVGIGTTDARGVLRLAGSSANAFPNNGGLLWLTDTNAATDYKNWSVSSINGDFGVARGSDAFNTAQNAYKITGAATQGYVGEHIWYTNNSSEKVRIDNSGRLLVGTSSTSSNTTLLLQGYSGTSGPGVLRCCTTTSGPTSTEDLGYIMFGDAMHVSAAWIQAQRDGGTWTAGSSHPGRLVFSTTADGASSPTERMRIDSAGQVGIGVSPSLGVRTAIKASSGGGQALTLLPGGAGDVSVSQLNITKFDNNTTSSQYFVQFNINDGAAASGRIVANGANQAAFASTSDVRLKENIQNLPSQLEKLCSLRPVEFDYVESEGGGHQIGFIAQELQKIYPDAVSAGTDENQYLSVTGWSKTEARLVKALQEAVAKIESLEARLTAAGI